MIAAAVASHFAARSTSSSWMIASPVARARRRKRAAWTSKSWARSVDPAIAVRSSASSMMIVVLTPSSRNENARGQSRTTLLASGYVLGEERYQKEKNRDKCQEFTGARAAADRIPPRRTQQAPRAPAPHVRWRVRAQRADVVPAARRRAPAGRAAPHPRHWAAAPPTSRARAAPEQGWA